MQTRVKEIADRLGVKVRILSDEAEINSLSSARKRRAKGWYDAKTDEVVIIAPNNRDIADIEATIAHEVIAHQGLRRLIGKERFDAFLNEIYDRASERIKSAIDRRAEQERLRYIEAETARLGVGILARAEATSTAADRADKFRRTATEEYMAEMAERISIGGFERMNREEQSMWGHIKERVTRIINAIKEVSGISTSTKLTDKDIADILYRSYKNLRDGSNQLSPLDIDEKDMLCESARLSLGMYDASKIEKPNWKQTLYALSNSPSRAESTGLNSTSNSDSGKLQKISENLLGLVKRISSIFE